MWLSTYLCSHICLLDVNVKQLNGSFISEHNAVSVLELCKCTAERSVVSAWQVIMLLVTLITKVTQSNWVAYDITTDYIG